MNDTIISKVVTGDYRREMDGLEVNGHFLFPAEKRSTVNNIMCQSFHMMPEHITCKRFSISKIEGDSANLRLTRNEDTDKQQG